MEIRMKKGMVRSARGEVIDMAALSARNSTVVAIGNANMNARGDLVDRAGKVLKSRETVVQDYYNSNPKAVTQTVSLKDLGGEVLTPAQMASKAEEAGIVMQNKVPPKPKRKVIQDDDET
jgi:hypothetical protein